MVADDEDQEYVNGVPNFEAHDNCIIDFMHTIAVMDFPDEAIRIKKQERNTVPLIPEST